MCLALLEQMELVASDRVFVYFLLLQPIQQGLLQYNIIVISNKVMNWYFVSQCSCDYS